MAASSSTARLPWRSLHSSREISVPDMADGSNERRPRELHVLFASTGCTSPKIIDDLLPRLAELHHVEMRAVLDTGFRAQDLIKASSHCLTVPNTARGNTLNSEDIEYEAAELCEWANLLVLGPIDANTLAKMLSGHTDNLLLEILRSWNVSKKILLVPGMSGLMWENPMTKKQLTKIRRKWNWIQVLPPILWHFEDDKKKVASWAATTDLVDAVRNQVDLMNIGHGMDVSPSSRTRTAPRALQNSSTESESPINLLPPELWTLIFDFTGDWELAQTMHIYTNLAPPAAWTSHTSPHGPRNYMEALELTILRGNLADVKHFIATHSTPRWLSKLCIKLIMRFAMVPLLSHLEAEHKELFWATFGHTFLPDKASAVFGRTEILEFWRTSPSFLTKEYTAEALDGASRAGFVEVLEWWGSASLPLKFTEAALEQASSRGHVPVLEWWKRMATTSPTTNHATTSSDDEAGKISLKPGKSICYATQSGHLPVLKWWTLSALPFPHEDTVAKLASTHGHVPILDFWHAHKTTKFSYDNQVLVGASKNGHVGVLEWWKESGLRVEYKTMDVEEALEDGCEGARGEQVRRWWARNGLNLGVGTSEWMMVKVLEG
ncbi:hypothetical protein LTR08_007196 [Meristemomyces frigidus]|nr:hypothetical protein LTR08_007196 [Meristemomyces frigidus]